jgi:hypothetical protein
MVRRKLIKSRITELAEVMEVFTTVEMQTEINNYPNSKGKRTKRSQTVSINRLASYLLMDKNISILTRHNGKQVTVWEWIGDEE